MILVIASGHTEARLLLTIWFHLVYEDISIKSMAFGGFLIDNFEASYLLESTEFVHSRLSIDTAVGCEIRIPTVVG